MLINNNNNVINFKSSHLNILATADNHGDVLSMMPIVKATELHKKDIFINSNDKNVSNVFAIAGDWFMNTQKTGLLTNPELSNGDIQFEFLKKVISSMKDFFPNKNFQTLYTPGNHCLDGGDTWLLNNLPNADMTSIISNANLEKSIQLNNLMKNTKNIVSSKIISIPDNKNNKKTNNVLFLGVTIPTTDYYNPDVIENLYFYDNCTKNDVALSESDLKKTISVLNEKIENFKENNPNGFVVLLSHTGNKISKIFAQNIKDINLILNGHDHKEFDTLVGSTMIVSLGQNNSILKSIHLDFDNNFKLDNLRVSKFPIRPYSRQARNDENLNSFVQKTLEKDLVPLVNFKQHVISNEETVLKDSIRHSNSILANYVTSAIKRVVRQNYPNIDAVGIPSTIFRSGLRSDLNRTTFNNIDLIKMFDGVSANLSNVMIGEVKGKDLIALILENVMNNIHSPSRNGIIQWSDIQVNKNEIATIPYKKIHKYSGDAVKIRNKKNNAFAPIDPNKTYTILMSNKYLIKDTSNVKTTKNIRNNFIKLDETYDSLFRKYLELINYDVKITDKTKEQRIINL